MEGASVQTTPLIAGQNMPSQGSSSTSPFHCSPSGPTAENGVHAPRFSKPTTPKPETLKSSPTHAVSTPGSAIRSSSSSQSSAPNSAKASPSKKHKVKRGARNTQHGQQSDNGSNSELSTKAENLPFPSKDKSIKDLCKVEVSGYPTFAKPQDLQKLFSNYGQVRVEQVGRRFAVISFSSRNQAKEALNDSMKLCLYGQFLTIKPFTGMDEQFKKPNNKNKCTEGTVEPTRLQLSGQFSEQLETVLSAVRLTQEEVGALATLYADLERVLQQLWPGCQAMPFGSLTTGLGVKSSDADCFVNVPPQYRHAQFGFVNRAKRVLLQHPQLFADVFAIPRANTPIVKFLHVPTRTRCDLSFKTPLGALNSKLIAFLLHADPRLVPLAIVVKYWASVHALSGTGRLTNYALTLLLVFYLQRRGLLPPVAALQQDPADHISVDGWNSGFTADYRLLPPSTDPAPVLDLLGGFFAFYDAFDFDSLVVCPYLGRPLEKAAFAEGTEPPEELERYRRNVAEHLVAPLRHKVAICVQDPFEQCHNVASSVTARLASDVRAYFKFAAEAYEREKATGCAGLLRTILLEKPRLARVKAHPEYRVNLYPKILDTIIGDDWMGILRETVFTIFERILKMKLAPGEKEKTRNGRAKERYVTTLTKPLWKRKQFSRLYETSKMGFIEKHTKMTEEVVKVDKNTSAVEFQVILSFCTKIRSAWVSIRMTGGDTEVFYPFGKYYLSAMQNWVIGVLHAMGSTTIKDNLLKLDSTDAIDSTIVNSDCESDSIAEDNKESPECSGPEEAERPTEAPQPMEATLPTEASLPAEAAQPMEAQTTIN